MPFFRRDIRENYQQIHEQQKYEHKDNKNRANAWKTRTLSYKHKLVHVLRKDHVLPDQLQRTYLYSMSGKI